MTAHSSGRSDAPVEVGNLPPAVEVDVPSPFVRLAEFGIGFDDYDAKAEEIAPDIGSGATTPSASDVRRDRTAIEFQSGESEESSNAREQRAVRTNRQFVDYGQEH